MGQGLDPPKPGESHRVVIEFNGPLTEEQFRRYTAALKACLDSVHDAWPRMRRTRAIVVRPKPRRGGRGGPGRGRGGRRRP